MSAKEADTRTADSLTSDRKPPTQGESVGSMPEPSETSRDNESRPDPSGFWHKERQPVPTRACSKEKHLE
eukprot:2405977-Pleurochrysis_carterae.AAC.1